MLIIHHRRNTIELLKETNNEFGVELDIRSYGNKLVVHHDPFIDKVSLESWLLNYNHKFLILNIKEEGIEENVLNLMFRHQINDFFLLDQSFPSLIKTSRSGESRSAVRVSEYESIETALSLAGLVKWIWVDIFSCFPLDSYDYLRLKDAGFKLCLVSPELQGHPPSHLNLIQTQIEDLQIKFDAVCTKFPNKWLV